MSLAKRRLLFYCFIALFALIVPVVLLYATGNVINWQRLELEKTAGIIVNSDPVGASLTLNGKVPGTLARQFFGQAPDPHTRTKITGLRPGDYTVRLELAGYAPWEQKVTLYSGEVHNTGIIRLFRVDQTETVSPLPAPAEASALSPDGKTAAVLSQRTISFIQLDNGQKNEASLPVLPARKTLDWSPDGKKLLIGSDFIIDRNGQNIKTLADYITVRPMLARWSDNDELYAIQEQGLWRFDTVKNSEEKISSLEAALAGMEITDLQVENSRVFLLLASSAKSQLLIFEPSAPDRELRISLPAGSYGFTDDRQGNILVRARARGSLYRLERPLPLLSSYRLSLIAEDFSGGNWNGGELLYATPFELRRWTENDPEELITRWGDAVVDIARIPKSDYILFATSTSLNTQTAKNQPSSSSLRLAEIEHISSFLRVEEHGVYFLGRNKGQNGLFRLSF